MTKYFLSLFREKEKLISRRVCFSKARLTRCTQSSFSFLLFVCFFIFSVCNSQKGSNSQDFQQVARQLFSNFWYLEQLFNFVSCNVLHSEKFLSFSSNSQISEQPLELKLAFLKKRPDPPPGTDHGRKMHAAGLGQLVQTRIFTRLILILRGAHDYEAMGS